MFRIIVLAFFLLLNFQSDLMAQCANLCAAGVPTSICPGQSVQICGCSGYTWIERQWRLNSGPVFSTSQCVTLTEPGNYSLRATNTYTGQVVTCYYNLSVFEVSVPIIIPDPCNNGAVTLTASPSASYLWSNGETSQSITVNNSGDYSVLVVDENGCSSESALTSVFVNCTDNQGSNNNVPKGINYQAIARNSNGSVIQNSTIQLRFTLLKDSINGSVEYIETHQVSTSEVGLFTLTFGNGVEVLGTWEDIDWKLFNKYLKIEMDSGQGFIEIGTQSLLSVPFAMRAGTAVAADTIRNPSIPVYLDNDSALSAGLGIGEMYRTPSGILMVVY